MESTLWAISIKGDQSAAALKSAVAELATVTPFKVPANQLRVGTLDSLMSLSDDLVKMDSLAEATVTKMYKQLQDLKPDTDGPTIIGGAPKARLFFNSACAAAALLLCVHPVGLAAAAAQRGGPGFARAVQPAAARRDTNFAARRLHALSAACLTHGGGPELLPSAVASASRSAALDRRVHIYIYKCGGFRLNPFTPEQSP